MIPVHVSFTMLWRDDQLCFIFHGTTLQAVTAAFRHLSSLYSNYHVQTEQLPIINGKCHYNIVVTLTDPRTDTLSEADWPMMIIQLLQKESNCDVTFFEKFETFMNA